MKHIGFLFLILFSFSIHAETYSFPKDFQWCVATAGHQIEGDNINSDWWEWEKLPGKIKKGDRSGKAAFHTERMVEDVALMKDLGVKTYRFSIEWARIEPKQGEFDQAAIDYYRNEIKLLKKNGIQPFVTMHHFVSPQWFTEMGGFKRDDSPEIFLNYVKKLDAEFGKDVEYWVTFNEPMVFLIGGFGQGVMPPGISDWNLFDPMVNILKAHAKAYHYFHAQAAKEKRKVSLGLAHHMRPLYGSNALIQRLVGFPNYLLNWNIPTALKTGELHGMKMHGKSIFRWYWPTKVQMDELKNTQDFLGVNYYTREYISVRPWPPFLIRDPMPGLRGTELLNWGLDPEGFYEVFEHAHLLFPELPFIITENGLTDRDDKDRAEYVASHLLQVHKTINTIKHPVIGYCYWSMMDNFEWIEGFDPRFGLYAVDYTKNGERKARPSVDVVRKIYKSNTLEYPLPNQDPNWNKVKKAP